MKIYIYGLCVLIAIGIMGCNGKNPNNGVSREEFFGVDLNQSNQVVKLHNLLIDKKVDYKGKCMSEWTDGMGTDYEFSEGKIVSIDIAEGDIKDVEQVYFELDSIFTNKYKSQEHLNLREWMTTGDNSFYFEYLNFYSYNTYRIGLTLRLVSPVKDEKNITSASVRVGLGVTDN